jgi:hypothetical protein
MISNIKEIVIVSLFSLLIIVQQSFVDRGSLSFGTKYALVLLATFVPYWVAHTLRLGPELRRTATFAIGLLFLVTAITISTSYAFGVGEFLQDGKTVRAFGWLGDSFTPVIVFLVIYYCFRRQLVLALLSFAMLLLTGGKAATFMLITMPVLVFFSNASRRMKVIVAVLSLVLLLVVLRLAAPIVETKMPLPVVEYSINTRLLSIYNGLNYS